MAGPRVAITTSSFGRDDDEPLRRLRGQGIDVHLNPHGRTLTEREAAEFLREADGVVAGTEPLNRSVLAASPRLRVISRVGVGLDNVDLDEARRRGIAVFTTAESATDAVAELTVGGLLSVLRHLHRMDAEIRAGRWTKLTGGLIHGRTVGIIGLGRIGRRVAELLAPFQPKLVGTDVAPDRNWAEAHRVRMRSLEELLAESDVVLLHAPGDAGQLLGAAELHAMKRGAILVNTARGGLVDEAALADALQSGHLAGAYLDVFAEEPYRGPLRSLPNVLLTPHIGTYAKEARVRMEREAVDHLLSVLVRKETP